MISPLAYIDPAAKVGNNVTIQPFAYIEADVEIGDDCVIMPQASILNGTRLGKTIRFIKEQYLVLLRKIFIIQEKKALS